MHYFLKYVITACVLLTVVCNTNAQHLYELNLESTARVGDVYDVNVTVSAMEQWNIKSGRSNVRSHRSPRVDIRLTATAEVMSVTNGVVDELQLTVSRLLEDDPLLGRVDRMERGSTILLQRTSDGQTKFSLKRHPLDAKPVPLDPDAKHCLETVISINDWQHNVVDEVPEVLRMGESWPLDTQELRASLTSSGIELTDDQVVATGLLNGILHQGDGNYGYQLILTWEVTDAPMAHGTAPDDFRFDSSSWHRSSTIIHPIELARGDIDVVQRLAAEAVFVGQDESGNELRYQRKSSWTKNRKLKRIES